jgi:hypothetical protein
MNLTKRLKVTPGSQAKLSSIDPSFHGKWKDGDDAKPELDRNLSRITTLQRKLYAAAVFSSCCRASMAPARMARAGT